MTATVPNAATGSRLHVGSEVEPLRRVILHRPGDELRRLTPENISELLFDDVVWVERAVQEHDVLSALLRDRGVEVLLLEDLLAETLELEAAREEVLARSLFPSTLGVELGREVRAWLGGLDGHQLARHLIGGITIAELPFSSRSVVAQVASPETFALAPLPNHLFARDACAWAFGGVSVHTMREPARRREAVHLDAILRHHPVFAGTAHDRWDVEDAALEGGDILVIGNRAVLVGMGARTQPAAVELYARALFAAGAADRVIAVAMPSRRSMIHLDALLTMVDFDAFTVHLPALAELRAFTLTPAPREQISVRPEEDLLDALARALGVSRLHVIPTGGDPATASREQWNEANNLLALAPGLVVGYERNVETNQRLADAGIEVLPVPGSELARGRGGPRCMSCPIERGFGG